MPYVCFLFPPTCDHDWVPTMSSSDVQIGGPLTTNQGAESKEGLSAKYGDAGTLFYTLFRFGVRLLLCSVTGRLPKTKFYYELTCYMFSLWLFLVNVLRIVVVTQN